MALSSGLRMLLIRMCETMPIDGRMAMYTSGWPKNQNKCCHSKRRSTGVILQAIADHQT